MSIGFSMSLGYGIAIEDADASAVLKEFDPYENEIPNFLEENRFDLLGFDYCGDWVTGNTVYFFYVKDSALLHEDIQFLDTVYDFNTNVSVEAQDQLERLAFILTAAGDYVSIGWKLIGNVH